MTNMTDIIRIIESITQAGGRAFVVGGFVRDMFTGQCNKDIDVEVFGLPASELAAVLSTFGQVDMVGASFGVFQVHGIDCQFSLPRTDSKVAPGHRGFVVEADPNLDIAQAGARRDFTMNSMSLDVQTGNIVDIFGGVSDIQAGILRHVSPAFADDPLRVLRGMQFAGRFNMTLAPETAALCQTLAGEFSTLAVERVWGEFEKWATRSVVPSQGLRFLVDSGWVHLFPVLAAMLDVPQDSEFHPEGDLWSHTLLAVDAAAQVETDSRLVLVLAALLHDAGKPTTTTIDDDGRIRSHGHPQAGAGPAAEFLSQIGCPAAIAAQVVALVVDHMAHLDNPGRTAVGRLVSRLAAAGTNVQTLVQVIGCDHAARPPLAATLPAGAERLLALAAEVGAAAGLPAPLVMGRHLLAAGWQAGPPMGVALRAAFAAQLAGEFATLDDGLAWISDWQ